MPTAVDPRYLSVHPATLAWWSQRDKCKTCKHMMIDGDPAMRCTLTKRTGKGRSALLWTGRHTGVEFEYCIDARLGACGPEGKLWSPK